jgi:hypothetical protein
LNGPSSLRRTKQASTVNRPAVVPALAREKQQDSMPSAYSSSVSTSFPETSSRSWSWSAGSRSFSARRSSRHSVGLDRVEIVLDRQSRAMVVASRRVRLASARFSPEDLPERRDK